jgi:hypothetical protein
MNWHLNASAILIAIIWSGFIVWSMRKFWRMPSDAAERSYRVVGKGWAIMMTLVLAFLLPTVVSFPGMSYWLEVVYFGFIGLPIAIIVGHFFGRCMQTFMRWRSGK